MGLVARYPFARPGMGLNAYFAYTVVLGQKIRGRRRWAPYSFRRDLRAAVAPRCAASHRPRDPEQLKIAVTAGIGLFLAFLGLKNAGAVIAIPPPF